MSYVYRPVLLALAATAVLAFAASSASATALSATAEPGGGACSTVSSSGSTGVSGGCLVHATSEGGIVLKKHVFGIESTITTCNNEFHGRVGNTAIVGVEGYIYEQVLSGAGCTRQACQTGGEGVPWLATGTEAVALEGNEHLTTNFCVEPVGGGTDETCEIDVPFNETFTDHRYEFGHASEMPSHGISGFRCELDGHWNTEVGGSEDAISETHVEINHGGGGGGGSVEFDEGTVDFEHTTGVALITVRNLTGAEYTTENVVLSGSDTSRFEINTGCKNQMLAHNGTCTVTVTRMATADESKEAKLKLQYMQGGGSYQTTNYVHLMN